MTITTDPNDPRLTRGVDEKPRPQAEAYLVLPPEDLAKGFVKPLRLVYVHATCGKETRMPAATGETYARDPWFYGATYCVHCAMHKPLSEFTWQDGEPMDPAKWPAEEKIRIAELRASRGE